MRYSASGGSAATLAALCVVLLALSPSASYASPAIDPAKAPIACACPMIYAPVCGSDGITYGNDCPIVKCGNGSVKVVSKGPCPEKVPVATKPAPVNPSTAAKPVPVPTQKPATQRPRCMCNRMYLPVCASNGKFSRTFPSECVMKCSPGTWTILNQGPCDTPKPRGSTYGSPRRSTAPLQKPGCACPYIFMPVCASNGVKNRTFSNDCLATKCAVGQWQVVSQGPCAAPAAKRHQGGHSKPGRWAGSVGTGVAGSFVGSGAAGVDAGGVVGGQRPQGTSQPCVCPRIYLPVCAKDLNSGRTKTFDNACQVERCTNNSYQMMYTGACKDTATSGTVTAPVTRPSVTRPTVTRPTVTRPTVTAPATKPPVACACPAIYAPVCGTDGVTYDNDCLLTRCRQPGGPTVAYQGPCKAGTAGAPAASGLARKLLGLESASVPHGPGDNGVYTGDYSDDVGDIGDDVNDEPEGEGWSGDMEIPAAGAFAAAGTAMPLPNVPVVTQAGVYNIDAMAQAVTAQRPQWVQQVWASAAAGGQGAQGVVGEEELGFQQGGEQGFQQGGELQGFQQGEEQQGGELQGEEQQGDEEQGP